MNRLEAAELAQRLVGGWPQRSAITADEWASELLQLEAGIAGACLVRLRRERTAPPSIAEFLRSYRVLLSSARPNVEPVCVDCDGSGWIESRSLIIGDGEHERGYSQVEPCRCDAGRGARDVQSRIAAQAPSFRWPVRTGPPMSEQELSPAPASLPKFRPGDPVVDVDSVLL